MTDYYNPDPLLKVRVFNALDALLFKVPLHQFQARLSKLIELNTIVGQHRHPHFWYKGAYYAEEETPKVLERNFLADSLRPQMDAFIEERAAFEKNERRPMRDFMFFILNTVSCPYDMLLIFPSAVHDTIKATVPAPFHSYKRLPEADMALLLELNEPLINKMRERLVLNLLINI